MTNYLPYLKEFSTMKKMNRFIHLLFVACWCLLSSVGTIQAQIIDYPADQLLL